MSKAPPPPHDPALSAAEMEALVRKYDSETNFRRLGGLTGAVVTVLCITLSLFHIYTAGYGLLNEVMHRSVHMAFIMPLVFLLFPRVRAERRGRAWGFGLAFAGLYVFLGWTLAQALAGQIPDAARWGLVGLGVVLGLTALPIDRVGGHGDRLAFYDWPLAIAGAGFSLYLIVFFDSIFIQNVGFPQTLDYIVGMVAIIIVLEAARRTMGETLPVIGALALIYAIFGPYLPGDLAHRGYNIIRLVNHLYLGTEGIYGIAIGVVATFVFHFVLFGVLAQKSGLGQLFIDLASIVAGRYSGGPAKVAVVSSGFFGMISGSPIANTVTTGAFTIPMMKAKGFSGRFAAATEASASCGGQVTPPIMGAAAFVMTEMLGVPYNELILIAIIPAAFHYLSTLFMVHLEARRLGLSGMDRHEIPRFLEVLGRSWHLFIPLIVMVTMLLMRYTPFLAAFWGIILTIVCSYIPLILQTVGLGRRMDAATALTPWKLKEALESGAQQSISITAACACVGFILGVTTLTGMGFKFSGAVIDGAAWLGTALYALNPLTFITQTDITLFFALIFVAIACIIMGAGIPTTPTYIILAAIAAPALQQLGVPLLATHFFVFYYGVLADITPPVALAAYAGAGIARSDPMQTGMTAFRLSMGKALVPMMFIYAPALLFIDFTVYDFTLAIASGVLSIVALSIAYIGFFQAPVARWEKVVLTVAGLVLVAHDEVAIALAASVVLAIMGRNWAKGRAAATAS
ncbi:TRAP transporter permease [Pararhodobacter sp. SW119]|uniref:TRAP transporter permease n=1 Tax=Pararhodobacter sp. SW119 TaxID=2780075 RepID=UPI001AE00AD6|nr:TRAP transporter permease [Pararhodobacter sp. SW119]